MAFNLWLENLPCKLVPYAKMLKLVYNLALEMQI